MKRSRTRFARVYGDGSIGVTAPGTDFLAARQEMFDGHEDDDVELLEVELNVIRSHGKPLLQAVTEHSVTYPTCGEEVFYEVAKDS